MLSEAHWEAAAKSATERLSAGQRIITNDQTLDKMDGDFLSHVRTCRNRNQRGTLDQYVAWVADKAKPTDLEFDHNGYARGSV